MNEEPKLFVVYLGGSVAPGRMGEDHEVVVVVAPDAVTARRQAKAKWGGLGKPHVDSVQELIVIDGHDITLTLRSHPTRDYIKLDPEWEP